MRHRFPNFRVTAHLGDNDRPPQQKKLLAELIKLSMLQISNTNLGAPILEVRKSGCPCFAHLHIVVSIGHLDILRESRFRQGSKIGSNDSRNGHWLDIFSKICLVTCATLSPVIMEVKNGF